MAHKIIRLPEVKKWTGLSKTGIYEAMKGGTFPRSVSLGARAVGWIESAVVEWINSRPPTVANAGSAEKR